jgi:hypothetical protein
VKYIESFTVPGVPSFGIEKREKENDYYVWVGGCGIGGHETIQGARDRIFWYAKEELQRKIDAAQAELRKLSPVISSLEGDDVFNLGKYKVYNED